MLSLIVIDTNKFFVLKVQNETKSPPRLTWKKLEIRFFCCVAAKFLLNPVISGTKWMLANKLSGRIEAL